MPGSRHGGVSGSWSCSCSSICRPQSAKLQVEASEPASHGPCAHVHPGAVQEAKEGNKLAVGCVSGKAPGWPV